MRTVVDAFLENAQCDPERVAVVIGPDESVTYGELKRQMEWVQAHLQTPATDGVVLLMMERGPLGIAAFLGAWAAGLTVVPVDPRDPTERIRVLMQRSGADRVLTDRGTWAAENVPAGTTVLTVDSLGAPPALQPRTYQQRAYVLFTSGSTGVPKGVAVSHESLLHLLRTAGELISFAPSDRILAAATVGFDISLVELFLPLVMGGSLLLRNRNIWLEPVELASDIEANGVSVVQCGPAAWAVALGEVDRFPPLRVAITTSEALPPALGPQIAAIADEAWNLYGPTEATVWATGKRLGTGASDETSIGHPLAGVTVEIIDEAGRPVSPGTIGELFIGGAGLAMGYHGDAAATSLSFIETENGRRYRTGDRAAWSPDGEVLFRGRCDDQVKIRGVRVEPGEVEAALHRHPQVQSAAVVAFASPTGNALAAMVVPQGILSSDALSAWLADWVPAQMIPTRWLLASQLPLSPAGKVDRKQVLDRVRAESVSSSAPLTDTEQRIAAVWSELLGISKVAPNSNFFNIGGDSLAAVRMARRLEACFGIPLEVQVSFQAPTLAALAAHVDAATGNAGHQPPSSPFIFPLVTVPGSRPVFFSGADMRLAQPGLWQIPCSLYAIAHWAPGAGFVESNSLEALAAQHCAEVVKIQPNGPYRLAGYSFGGVLVLEMARQFRASGEDVELLFVLDPMTPHRPGNPMPPPLHIRDKAPGRKRVLKRFVQGLRRPGRIPQDATRSLFWRGRRWPLVQRAMYRLVHLHGRKPNAVSEMLLPKGRWAAYWFMARHMTAKYLAEPYRGDAAGFFHNGPASGFAAWKELLPEAKELVLVEAIEHSAVWEDPAMTDWQRLLECHLHSESFMTTRSWVS